MKIRTKRVFSIAISVCVAVIFFAAITVAYREYHNRKMAREETILKNLVIDHFEFKETTLEDAVHFVVEKVHALGHPEFRAHIYKSSREAPHFHAQLHATYFQSPIEKMKGTLTSIPLVELLKLIGGAADSTCELIGHDLVVVPEIGTSRPFRRATFRLDRIFFKAYSLDDFTESGGYGHNLTFYRDMTLEFDRERSRVEIFAPESEIVMLEAMLSGFIRPSLWEEAKYKFQAEIDRLY